MPIDSRMVKWDDAPVESTGPKIDPRMVKWTDDTPDEPPAKTLSKTDRLLKGLRDPIDGGAQLLTNMLPQSVVQAGNSLNNFIADKTGLVPRLPAGGVDEQVRLAEQAYQANRGDNSFDGMRVLGNIISPANLAIAARTPQAATLAGRVGIGALSGGASASLNPVANGDFADEKLKQIGIGALTGGAVPAVMGGAARVISPKNSVNPDLALLTKEGVSPTVGQRLGGWANTLEERAQSLPIVGDAIAAARSGARDQFNNAAINRATAPIGVKVEGQGTAAIEQAGNAISKVYDQAKAAMGGFKIDQTANSELSNLRMLATSGLQGRERSTVNNYFKDYLNRPSLTAESFKELDSKLTSDIAKFGAGDAYQQKVGDALKEVQRIVTENARRANPKAEELFSKADAAYANLVRVEGAAVGAKGADGVFTPGQLLTAVRGADKSVRDRATARGTALMQDLASAGQSVLGSKVPDSGTAGRLLTAGSGAAALANPVATFGGLLGGAAMYSRPMQGLLGSMVSNRPELAQPIANSLRQSAPMLIPGGAQVGLGLLNY